MRNLLVHSHVVPGQLGTACRGRLCAMVGREQEVQELRLLRMVRPLDRSGDGGMRGENN